MLADEGPMRHVQQIFQQGRPFEEREYSKPAYSVTVGVVCERCNNRWMSDLESRAKLYLEPMLQNHGRLLHEGGQRLLATWALKTSMMLEHMHGAGRRCIPSQEYEHLFSHSEPSERIRIWMASYEGSYAVAVGSAGGFDVQMAGEVLREWEPDRGLRDVWAVTILFGPVVFQVSGTTIPWLLDGVELQTMKMHGIWPYQHSFTWAREPGFDERQVVGLVDLTLNQFRRQLRAKG
jgi:hypothetical protein